MTIEHGRLHAVPLPPVEPPTDEPPDAPTEQPAAPGASRAPEDVLGRWLDEHGPRRAPARQPSDGTGARPLNPLDVARDAQQQPAAEEQAPRHAARRRILPRLPGKPGPVAEPEPEWLPDYVEYRTTNLPQVALGVLFVGTVVAAVISLFWAASVGSGSGLVATGVLALAAGALWWALLEWAPTVVSLSQGQLEVARGERTRRFDLRSTSTRVDLGANPRALRWRAVVSRPGEPPVVIRRQHVKARQFCEIVSALRP